MIFCFWTAVWFRSQKRVSGSRIGELTPRPVDSMFFYMPPPWPMLEMREKLENIFRPQRFHMDENMVY